MKKLLSTLLLAALLMTTAACAADASVDDDAVATDTKDALETTTADETVPPEYIAPEGVDYGGLTFTVAANQWGDIGWVLSDYCEILAEEESGEPINDAIYQRNRVVEEELNVKFELFPIPKMSSTTEIMTAVMSGDDVFYFAAPNGTSMRTFLNGQDIFVNLADIESLDLGASWWDKNAADEFRIFDKQYAITGDFNFYDKGAPICNLFSKKLVEDLKLDNLYDIVRDGAWTIDEFIKYAEAAARDINGDGEMTPMEDCWGVFAEAGTLSQFITTSDQRLSKFDSDGNLEIVVNTEKTVNIVQKVVPFLCDQKINALDPDYKPQYTSVFTEFFLPKFIDDGAMFFTNQILVALNLRNMESDFGIIPMPKYDEAQDDYVSTISTSWTSFVFVPVTCGDLEMTGNVLNALGYYSQQFITPAFIDQTVMSKAIRDDDTAEMLELIYDTMSYDIAMFFNWGGVSSIFSTFITGRHTNFSSSYAGIEEQVMSQLDATIAQLKGN